MKREDLSIGQEVWVYGQNGPAVKGQVTMIGRTLVTIATGPSRYMEGKYYIETQDLRSDYSGSFLTLEQFAAKEQEKIDRKYLADQGLKLDYFQQGYSSEKLHAVAEFLRENYPLSS